MSVCVFSRGFKCGMLMYRRRTEEQEKRKKKKRSKRGKQNKQYPSGLGSKLVEQ